MKEEAQKKTQTLKKFHRGADERNNNNGWPGSTVTGPVRPLASSIFYTHNFKCDRRGCRSVFKFLCFKIIAGNFQDLIKLRRKILTCIIDVKLIDNALIAASKDNHKLTNGNGSMSMTRSRLWPGRICYFLPLEHLRAAERSAPILNRYLRPRAAKLFFRGRFKSDFLTEILPGSLLDLLLLSSECPR